MGTSFYQKCEDQTKWNFAKDEGFRRFKIAQRPDGGFVNSAAWKLSCPDPWGSWISCATLGCDTVDARSTFIGRYCAAYLAKYIVVQKEYQTWSAT
jgi:hypothetical protein